MLQPSQAIARWIHPSDGYLPGTATRDKDRQKNGSANPRKRLVIRDNVPEPVS